MERCDSLADGYITLGVDSIRRPYRLAMFYAPECLDTIRQNVLQRKANREKPTLAEAHFCLDCIRQTIQCRSDT
ncbi:hypothetical protein DFH11DRAFT_1571123 [Phellopilus nigrolimitatus]|nr:hypothetical protein DFH11DRAFT_1571123 [Phellopilus nigrolimitatus]